MSTEGIILAAGLSKRTHPYHKMVLPLGDKTVIEQTVDTMLSVCSTVFVVVGYQKEDVSKLFTYNQSVKIIENEHYEQSMFLSVKKGVEQISAPSFFMCPGDYPLVQQETYQIIAESLETITIPSYNNIKGHPVHISGCYISDILNEPDTSSLRAVINRLGFTKIEVDDEGVLLDIDDMQTYNELLKRL